MRAIGVPTTAPQDAAEVNLQVTYKSANAFVPPVCKSDLLIAASLLVSCVACGTSDGGDATVDTVTVASADTTSTADVAAAADDAGSTADADAENTEDTGPDAGAAVADAASSVDAAPSDAISDEDTTQAVDAAAPVDVAKKDCKCGENQWSCLCGDKGCGNGAYGASPGKHLCAKTEEKMWENFMPNTYTGWWCDKETNCK